MLSQDWRYVFLDGFHAVKHAIRFSADIPVIITDRRSDCLDLATLLASDIVDTLAAQVLELSEREFVQLVPKPHVTRVAAMAARPSMDQLRATLYTRPRVTPTVLLENPRNLGNVGAVVRLAAGFSASGVITTGTVDPWHTQVIRGAAGLHFATAVLSASIDDLPQGPLLALDADGDDIRGIHIPDNALLAFGSERQGISLAIRRQADQLVSIPMRARVSSYNLATSVAMTLFHWASGCRDQPFAQDS